MTTKERNALLRNTGLKIYFIPSLIAFIPVLLLNVSFTAYNLLTHSMADAPVEAGTLIEVILGFILSVFFTKKYYIEAFSQLSKGKAAENTWLALFITHESVAGLTSYAYRRFAGSLTHILIGEVTTSNPSGTLMLVSLISNLIGIALGAAAVVSTVYLFDRLTDTEEGVLNERKFIVPYALIAVLSVLGTVVAAVLKVYPDASSSIFSIISSAVRLAWIAVIICVIKNKRLLESKAMRIACTVITVLLALLLPADSVMSWING